MEETSLKVVQDFLHVPYHLQINAEIKTLKKVKDLIVNNYIMAPLKKQATSARERALCQLTVCFEFQSDRRKGHKSCALQMVFRRKVTR